MAIFLVDRLVTTTASQNHIVTEFSFAKETYTIDLYSLKRPILIVMTTSSSI